MLEQNDEKHEAGHGRLRRDLRELELQVDQGFQSLRDSHATLRQKIASMETTPVDAGKLVMTPRIVATVVAMSISVFGGIWASTYGLRSDVRDILTRMEYQTKTQDERADAQREAIKEIRNRLELYKIELQQQIKDSAPPGRKQP